MSEQDVKPVSSATGVFAAPQVQLVSDAASGNGDPETGNNLPVPEKASPDMEELARNLNIAIQSIGRDLRFEVDMQSGQSVIQVLDRVTGELIRQIPPEKAEVYLSDSGSVALRLYDARI